jgi:cytochrome c-type biogenesis protein
MPELDVSYLGAAVAGLLSFLSPCVLPLVPPYLCFLGGVTLEELGARQAAGEADTRRVVLAAVFFVLGFATVFVALGATASAIGGLVTRHFELLAQIAGGLIVLLGLNFLGLLRIGVLFREARFHPARRPAGLAGAYLIGLAFAFGWTPCVGPVLATILFVAGSEESAVYGASLLGAYAAGLGIPFVAAAFAARPFGAFMARFRRYVGAVEKVLGALLVATGVLFITGSMADLSYWLLETFPGLSRIG